MTLVEFFQELRVRKHVLYVPYRIYRAHQDRVLSGWGMSDERHGFGKGRLLTLLKLLKEQDVNFKLPYTEDDLSRQKQSFFNDGLDNYLVIHENDSDCPPFPNRVLISDKFWDSFLRVFGIAGRSVTNVYLPHDGWVHHVRFFTLWANYRRSFPYDSNTWHLSPAEVREYNRQAKEVSEANRVLRVNYGLTGADYYNLRRPTLVVLKKAYPPEQIKRLRRLSEEELRKNPAETLRFALAHKLDKR